VRVKVLDFGLARLAEASGVTNAGMAVGTPSFMSPEQAAGRSLEIDGRTDIFALGATIFRIVTGRRIHDADNMVQLVVLMASNPAPALRTILPTASEPFAAIVDKALTFDRDDRPQAKVLSTLVRKAIDDIGAPAGDPAGATLTILPFSARNVRVASAAEIKPPQPEPVEAKEAEKKKESEPPPPDSEQPAKAKKTKPPKQPIAKSATLPWLIVLVLLGIGMWRLLPSLQDELVQRAKVWVSAPSAKPPTATPEPSALPTSETTPTNADNTTTDAGAALDLDDDGPDDDAGPEAANPPADDAATAAVATAPIPTPIPTPRPPPAVAARPHPTTHGPAAKPQPPAKKQPPPPPRGGGKRRH